MSESKKEKIEATIGAIIGWIGLIVTAGVIFIVLFGGFFTASKGVLKDTVEAQNLKTLKYILSVPQNSSSIS